MLFPLLSTRQHLATVCARLHHATLFIPAMILVTPWNAHGYDTAEWFRHKFDYIAPVWFTIKPLYVILVLPCLSYIMLPLHPFNACRGSNSFEVEGAHDVDEGWLQRLKSNHSRLKITPRFHFQPSPESFRSLVDATATSTVKLHIAFIGVVVEICEYLTTLFLTHARLLGNSILTASYSTHPFLTSSPT